MARSNWEKRIGRAEELLDRKPSSAQVLAFYLHLLGIQQQMRRELDSRSTSATVISTPLREQLDIEFTMAWVPRLLDTLQKHGPAKLAEEAGRIGAAGIAEQRKMLAEFLRDGEPPDGGPASFLARVLFQPSAEFEASKRSLRPVSTRALCPVCGGKPQFAVLRPEGDGGKRHLVCSFCLTEWEFRRVICPACEETDHERLPRYSPEEPIAVHVEACDTCKAYLKSFDMTVDGLMVPEVEEIASVALDVWATARGYHKIQLNLLGF
jgi:FdhE protein